MAKPIAYPDSRPDPFSVAANEPVRHERIMWVTPTRVAYRSLFGHPRTRTFGAWLFYVALDRPFEITVNGGPPRRRWIELVAPYTPHRVSTVDRSLAQLLLEAETVSDPAALQNLVASAESARAARQRILNGFDTPLPDTADFDRHFFGSALPVRRLDPRIAIAVERIAASHGENLTAEDCAAQAGLSFSRFTHLFTRETGSTFRRLRAWKRARNLLLMVGTRGSLVDVALDAGYADSTHFSHAIRKFYGYKPSEIFAGSRRLAVIFDGARPAAV